MAGFNLQDSVDQGLTKVASATAAAKSIKQQEASLKEQENLRKDNEKHAKEIEARNNKIIAIDYGIKLSEAENQLYLHNLDAANEIRKEPGKQGFHFVDNKDIEDYYNRKYLDYDNKYTWAVLDRDMAMRDPKYKDKRTRAGRRFSKAEKDMDMYHKAEAEIIQQMHLHHILITQKDKFKEQLDLAEANANEYVTSIPSTKPKVESTSTEHTLKVRPV